MHCPTLTLSHIPQVSRERLGVRHLRSYSVPCTWFVWSPECLLLLLCCGTSPSSTTLQPFSFKPGQSTKLAKFEGVCSILLCLCRIMFLSSIGTNTTSVYWFIYLVDIINN